MSIVYFFYYSLSPNVYNILFLLLFISNCILYTFSITLYHCSFASFPSFCLSVSLCFNSSSCQICWSRKSFFSPKLFSSLAPTKLYSCSFSLHSLLLQTYHKLLPGSLARHSLNTSFNQNQFLLTAAEANTNTNTQTRNEFSFFI